MAAPQIFKMEKCVAKKCKRPIDIKVNGLWLCEMHWAAYCSGVYQIVNNRLVDMRINSK
jgi:hypothetical protein